MRAVICLAVLLGVPMASDPGGDPFRVFGPSVTVTAADRARLERGLPIVLVLNAEGHELAVFAAIEVGSDVTADRMIAWMQNVAAFRKSSFVLTVRRFSNPPRIEDLETLTLDEGDLKDLEECRPGDCGLKLAVAEIEALQRVIQTAGTHRKAKVQATFKQLMLHRVVGYAAKGHAALDAYRDRHKPRSPAVAFDRLLQRSTFLQEHAPTIAATLARPSAAPADTVDEFMYWSKERFGGKAVINATHVRIFRPGHVKDVEVLMTGTQIFATHYLDACLGVTALVRDRRSSRGYFVYVNRSDVDLLEGFWGRFARRIVEGRVEEDGPAILREVARRLASGNPPASDGGAAPASRR